MLWHVDDLAVSHMDEYENTKLISYLMGIYGWRMMVKGNESQLVYHNGWWHGYTAAFYKNPSDETVIIVLSNIYNRNTYRVQAIWDILYGENGDMGFDQ